MPKSNCFVLDGLKLGEGFEVPNPCACPIGLGITSEGFKGEITELP